MPTLLKTILLLALPASGKSEVRRYLAHLSPEQSREEFHMGPTVQLDDFPYVHLMRRADDELAALGAPRLFFQSPDRPMIDPRDWGTLIALINEDYEDLVRKKPYPQASAAGLFLDRLEAAARSVGLPPRLSTLSPAIRRTLEDRLETEAKQQLDDKVSSYPDTLEGKTLVVEFARGGPDGSTPPLPAPLGYQHSLSVLAKPLLDTASILYVWVTPEESRRKNQARTNPDDPGSILHHGVPLAVMLGDYGCDDMDWLEANGRKPGTIPVDAHGTTFDVPIGRFDNRSDKTSFLREAREDWKAEDVRAIHNGLKSALDTLAGMANQPMR